MLYGIWYIRGTVSYRIGIGIVSYGNDTELYNVSQRTVYML